MLESFKANFPSKYQNESITCVECKAEYEEDETTTVKPKDTQLHNLTICPAYRELRLKYDLTSDIGIINYFKAVIARRTEKDILQENNQ